MVLVEIIIGQTIGVPHQALKKEFLNRTKLETLITGEFGGEKNLLITIILGFLHL